jgi:hypothetical protein
MSSRVQQRSNRFPVVLLLIDDGKKALGLKLKLIWLLYFTSETFEEAKTSFFVLLEKCLPLVQSHEISYNWPFEIVSIFRNAALREMPSR